MVPPKTQWQVEEGASSLMVHNMKLFKKWKKLKVSTIVDWDITYTIGSIWLLLTKVWVPVKYGIDQWKTKCQCLMSGCFVGKTYHQYEGHQNIYESTEIINAPQKVAAITWSEVNPKISDLKNENREAKDETCRVGRSINRAAACFTSNPSPPVKALQKAFHTMPSRTIYRNISNIQTRISDSLWLSPDSPPEISWRN